MITSSWPQFAQYTNHFGWAFRLTSRHLCVETRLKPIGSFKQSGRPRLADAPLQQPDSAPIWRQLQAHLL